MMTQGQRKLVWILIAVIFLGSAGLSEALRPGHEEYMRAGRVQAPGEVRSAQGTLVAGTSFEAIAPTILGVREVLASLMWVRADDYFHRGEYRPIMRLVRQITTIDPHQLDVYATGAWHMAYNFMDKRLIEDGVKFLEEGTRNNSNVYDLWFELGYMHYDKTKNYRNASDAYRIGSTKGTTTGKTEAPAYVRHQLAHALEKMGDIDQSIEQWQANLVLAAKLEGKGEVRIGPAGTNTQAAQHNLYITRRRRNERLAMVAERDGNRAEALRLWQNNVAVADEWLKREPGHQDVTKDRVKAVSEVQRLQAGKLRPVPPADIEFQFTVKRIQPRLLRVEGTANVLDLSRMHVRLQDKDYEERAARGFDFKMANCVLEWDNVSIRGGKFKHDFKLNQDPADMGRLAEEIYPLKADQYELTVRYNPRGQAAFIQDRYGWNGESLTAKKEMLKEDSTFPGILEGKRFPVRTVERTIILTKEDIEGKGEKVLYPR